MGWNECWGVLKMLVRVFESILYLFLFIDDMEYIIMKKVNRSVMKFV